MEHFFRGIFTLSASGNQVSPSHVRVLEESCGAAGRSSALDGVKMRNVHSLSPIVADCSEPMSRMGTIRLSYVSESGC